MIHSLNKFHFNVIFIPVWTDFLAKTKNVRISQGTMKDWLRLLEWIAGKNILSTTTEKLAENTIFPLYLWAFPHAHNFSCASYCSYILLYSTHKYNERKFFMYDCWIVTLFAQELRMWFLMACVWLNCELLLLGVN